MVSSDDVNTKHFSKGPNLLVPVCADGMALRRPEFGAKALEHRTGNRVYRLDHHRNQKGEQSAPWTVK